MSRRRVRDAVATAVLVTTSPLLAAQDEGCDPLEIVNPVLFPPTGSAAGLPDWVSRYNRATFQRDFEDRPIGAPRGVLTEQHPSTWGKLVHFGESPAITIPILDAAGRPAEYTIENPVVVLTLNTVYASTYDGRDDLDAVEDRHLPVADAGTDGGLRFRPYELNDSDGTKNNWMTAHVVLGRGAGGFEYAPGTAMHHVRDVLGLGDCLDPNAPKGNLLACGLAQSVGVTGVGMPFMFPGDTTTAFEDPWEFLPGRTTPQPASARWWRQRLYVFVADRDAFVRPSFNPSMRSSTEALFTDDGRPIWGGDGYRFPGPDDALYAAYLEATQDFFGVTNASASGGKGEGAPYLGTAGFEAWLADWKANSWGPPRNWPSLGYASGFPFGGLGLTLDWTQFDPDAPSFVPGDLSGPFGANSEMIHASTEHPMFMVAVLEPHQYLAPPSIGEVPWCDTCPGDFNRDGEIDSTDLGMLLDHWDAGSEPSAEAQCFDLDTASPNIDAADLGELLANWGGCGWPLPELRPADCP